MIKMTFNQRNDYVEDVLRQFKTLHDRYTSENKQLTDSEWKSYIDSMDAIAGMYKDSNLEDFVGKLCMVFLDDTEMMQKKLREINNDN